MNGLITDLYQLTMANALFNKGRHERKVVFDRFYRKNPFNGGYTIVAGLEHLQQFVENFRFDEEDINYLESLHIFYPAFLDYLKDFRFKGNIYAVPEGTVVFPRRTSSSFPRYYDRSHASRNRFIHDYES